MQSVSSFRVSLGAVLLLAGCSAEPSDPPGSGGNANVAGTGGSAGSPAAGTGGSAAGTGGTAAGTGGATGGSTAGGTAGAAGGGGPMPVVDCAWQQTLTSSCAIAACHSPPRGAAVPQAGLILTPDATLVSRLKDVTGTLQDLNCSPDPNLYEECTTPPASCAPLVGMKIVNSQNPDESLMMKKLENVNCGNVMPMAPGDAAMTGWANGGKECIQKLVRAIAAMPAQ
jgi:hypothetical protein